MFRSLITGTAVVAATGIALVGEDPVVDTMVVVGFGVVVPLALGGWRPWAVAALAFWATAQHVADTPALSIPDMARLHGLTNGLGFVVVGLVATGSLSSLAPAPFRRRARA